MLRRGWLTSLSVLSTYLVQTTGDLVIHTVNAGTANVYLFTLRAAS